LQKAKKNFEEELATFKNERVTRRCGWLKHDAGTRRSLGFSLTSSFRPQNGPGVDSSSNRNEYKGYFLGVKTAVFRDWQPCQLHMQNV